MLRQTLLKGHLGQKMQFTGQILYFWLKSLHEMIKIVLHSDFGAYLGL